MDSDCAVIPVCNGCGSSCCSCLSTDGGPPVCGQYLQLNEVLVGGTSCQ
jgi:hypothetical protein